MTLLAAKSVKAAALPLILLAAARGEIIDRVVAVVAREAVAWSDLDREARLEAYFNGKPAGTATPKPNDAGEPAPEYQAVLDRLIDQRLLQHEMDQVRFPVPDDAQAKKRLAELRPAATKPADYGLREPDLLEYARRIERADGFLKIRLQDRELDAWMKELRSRLGVKIP